uniref:Uncharacterized protein n=1 Tax=Hucho hucho TaxID=62062 RepID=A0A4W5LFS6_9TELE
MCLFLWSCRLTLEQKELCRSRLKLLCYLDRLATYEDILGGPDAAEQRYDSEFFKKFRNQNIILSARTYARVNPSPIPLHSVSLSVSLSLCVSLS